MPDPQSNLPAISAPKNQQFHLNPIIKKLQEDVKALASKFQTSHSIHQKETRKLHQTITHQDKNGET